MSGFINNVSQHCDSEDLLGRYTKNNISPKADLENVSDKNGNVSPDESFYILRGDCL